MDTQVRREAGPVVGAEVGAGVGAGVGGSLRGKCLIVETLGVERTDWFVLSPPVTLKLRQSQRLFAA